VAKCRLHAQVPAKAESQQDNNGSAQQGRNNEELPAGKIEKGDVPKSLKAYRETQRKCSEQKCPNEMVLRGHTQNQQPIPILENATAAILIETKAL
jgi:hypothetical protein